MCLILYKQTGFSLPLGPSDKLVASARAILECPLSALNKDTQEDFRFSTLGDGLPWHWSEERRQWDFFRILRDISKALQWWMTWDCRESGVLMEGLLPVVIPTIVREADNAGCTGFTKKEEFFSRCATAPVAMCLLVEKFDSDYSRQAENFSKNISFLSTKGAVYYSRNVMCIPHPERPILFDVTKDCFSRSDFKTRLVTLEEAKYGA
jgi:hypothetical protein